MSSGIEDILNDILKDYKAIALKATKKAVRKGQQDIMKEAKRCLQQFYANYSPIMYRRTHHLADAITPYKQGKKDSSESYFVGVIYDPAPLEGVYKSNSRYHQSGDVWISRKPGDPINPNYGIPEGKWILDQYLAGSHGGVKKDNISTDALMKEFIDGELRRRIDKYITNALMDAIKNRL